MLALYSNDPVDSLDQLRFNMFVRSMVAALLLALATYGSAQEQPRQATLRLPGMQAGGQMLLPTQWSLQPAGKQLLVGDFRSL